VKVKLSVQVLHEVGEHLFIFPLVVLGGEYIVAFAKILVIINYIILEFTPLPLSFIPLPPFMEKLQWVSLFNCMGVYVSFTLLPLFPATSSCMLVPTPLLPAGPVLPSCGEHLLI
jgi:hypothetical protein